MTTDWRKARIAKNEVRFRDINERLEDGLRQVHRGPELQQFVCECGKRTCEEMVALTIEEFEAVRTDSRRFAVVPGHVFPETERIVDGNERYQVVEKFGDDAVSRADAGDERTEGSGGRRSDQTRP